MNKFKENIYNFRKENGFSQQGFAETVTGWLDESYNKERPRNLKKDYQYSAKAIGKWERGESIPPLEVVVLLAKKMNVSLDTLFYDEIKNISNFISFENKNPYTIEEKVKIAKAIDHIQYKVFYEKESRVEYQRIFSKIVSISCWVEEDINTFKRKVGSFFLNEYKNRKEAEKRAKELGFLRYSERIEKSSDSFDEIKNTEFTWNQNSNHVILQFVESLNSCIERHKKKPCVGIKEGNEIAYYREKISKEEALRAFRTYCEKFLLPNKEMITEMEVKRFPYNDLCVEVKIKQRFRLTKDELIQISRGLAEEVTTRKIKKTLGRLKLITENQVEREFQKKEKEKEKDSIEWIEPEYNEADYFAEIDSPSWADEIFYREEPDINF